MFVRRAPPIRYYRSNYNHFRYGFASSPCRLVVLHNRNVVDRRRKRPPSGRSPRLLLLGEIIVIYRSVPRSCPPPPTARLPGNPNNPRVRPSRRIHSIKCRGGGRWTGKSRKRNGTRPGGRVTDVSAVSVQCYSNLLVKRRSRTSLTG